MKVMAISPHTDDIELGCGATIAKLINEGEDVFVWTFSTGAPATGSNRAEFEEAMRRLGVKKHYLENFETRKFLNYRQEILDRMIMRGRIFNPDLVIVPSRANIHQDHVVIAEEAERAFREKSLMGYEMPWGDVRAFTNLCYIRVDAQHINIKIHALDAYKTQAARRYMKPEIIASLAMLRGMQVGADYAEALEVMRWIF
jgi:LmbE family N-acetylglucosaminyl deacetylase